MRKPTTHKPAEIHWEGDSREVLTGFPAPIRADLGFSLWQLQQGEMPASAARRMESVGSGVWELKEQDDRKWYRVIYLATIDHVIYVLHCFEKQSRKTDRRDLETAKERLARVRQRLQQQMKGSKDVRKNE
ncbi:MAG TPA: type II toxin-antitoxin system RelE/ParE family toxin [Candidatus Dormibacteraeota bacterium]|nr:type II toxin-antitoxin system RelE/ParE family toxin [Candidatus Dormibacteraeota bacterium]